MKSSLRNKLESLALRLTELDATLSSEDVVRDMDRYRALTRERADIEPVVASYREYARAESDVAAADELARDPGMKAFAAEEHASATAKMTALAADLQRMLLPQDPNDGRNVFLEIRAGTGGDESALFAGSLCRMYTRYAERAGWKVEIVSESPAELGGYKEVILRIIGRGAYSRLKFESGGHRVQRVPETEAQGRIHTSACTGRRHARSRSRSRTSTSIPPTSDRHVPRVGRRRAAHQQDDSAVRITHLPTGLVVECQDDRSQHRNRRRRWRCSRRASRPRGARAAAEGGVDAQIAGRQRRSQRAHPARTTFPQGRVTDHRINLTLHKIDAIMDGDPGRAHDGARAGAQAELLAALGDDK
jgi:peptide chain release factor 1